MNEYVHIGKIVATYGLKGDLILKHVLGKKSDFKNLEVLFIEELKDVYLPYFHKKSIAKNISETIITLEGVDSKEAATELLKKKIWLLKNDFEKAVSKTAPVNLIGFVICNNTESFGKVEAVIEQPHQVLLQLHIKNKEVLIPLNEETLQKIDRTKKQIHVKLPDGLLAIYLEK